MLCQTAPTNATRIARVSLILTGFVLVGSVILQAEEPNAWVELLGENRSEDAPRDLNGRWRARGLRSRSPTPAAAGREERGDGEEEPAEEGGEREGGRTDGRAPARQHRDLLQAAPPRAPS